MAVRDADYSLYVDLVYADGTPLWGQTAQFRTGTHDWEAREMIILPEKTGALPDRILPLPRSFGPGLVR